jgi:hydroxypyruvate reductase
MKANQQNKDSLLKDHELNALQIFNAAVASVKPMNLMQQHLYVDKSNITIGNHIIPLTNINKLLVIAVGKAAAGMAAQAEQQLGDAITAGICVTKYQHGLPLKIIKTVEAGHPIPDKNSIEAGAEILLLIKNLSKEDVVLVLLSGGASALMENLPDECTLQGVQQTVNCLMRCGAGIHEINTVRKKISKLKGGGLAAAAFPAQVHTLLLSDVVGDNLDVIASGPTVPDTTTFENAVSVLHKYNLWNDLPTGIKLHFDKGLKKEVPETPKAGELIFENCFTTIIGSNKIALDAALQEAESLGYFASIYKENVAANTERLAREMIKKLYNYQGPLPACFLLGGETTLAVKGNGKGGRNQHFVLCALDEMLSSDAGDVTNNFNILSAGTDGTDGPTDAAGATADLETYQNIPGIHQHLNQSLRQFDSYHFFEKYGGLIKTGATQTNVMDIILLIISPKM